MEGYLTEGDWLLQRHDLQEGMIATIKGRDLRDTMTGTHALVAIDLNETTLAYSVFNVGRDSDRRALVGSAEKQLGGVERTFWNATQMKGFVDQFCWGVRAASIDLTVGELTQGNPEIGGPTPILGHYIVKGGGSILFAPPGRAKSYMGLTMGVSLQAGCDALWPVVPKSVLYVNLERSRDSVAWRLSRIGRCLGLGERFSLPMLHRRGGKLADLLPAIERTVETYDCEVGFVDSLSRAGMGSMVDDESANRIMDALNKTFETWVLLAHTPHATEERAYGSVMFGAAADITIKAVTQLANDNYTVGMALAIDKANDIRKPPADIFAFDFDADGLTNIRASTKTEFPALGKASKQDHVTTLDDYLTTVGEASLSQAAKELDIPRTTLTSIVTSSSRYQKRRDGQSVLYSLLSQREEEHGDGT